MGLRGAGLRVLGRWAGPAAVRLLLGTLVFSPVYSVRPAAAHPGHVRPGGLYVAFRLEAERVRGGLNLPADQLARALGEDGAAVLAGTVPDAAALARLRDRLQALPAALAPTTVDGVPVTPTVERVDLLLRVPPPALYGAPTVPGIQLSPSPFPAAQVRYALPLARPPQRITVRWTRPEWLAPVAGDGAPPAPGTDAALDQAVAGTFQVPAAPGSATAVAGAAAWTEHTFHLTAQEPSHTWHAEVAVPAPVYVSVPSPRPPRRWPVWPVALGALGLAGAVALRRRPGWALGLGLAAGAGAWALSDTARFGVVVGVLDAGGRPADAEARRIFEGLLRAVYAAFEPVAPGDSGARAAAGGAATPVAPSNPADPVVVSAPARAGLVGAQDAAAYDALARAVDGPLLDWMYRQVFEALVQREHGGAVARLQDLSVLAAEITPAPAAVGAAGDPPGAAEDAAFGVEARWRVTGEVRHLDHTHRRTFEFSGRYVLAPRGAVAAGADHGGYRIVALQVHDQTRIDAEVPDGLLEAPR